MSIVVVGGLDTGKITQQLISAINLHFSEIEDVGTPPYFKPT